jgi:hypothetical protein
MPGAPVQRRPFAEVELRGRARLPEGRADRVIMGAMAVDDRAVDLWFQVYLDGFIGNDMTGAIRGTANYGAALMLVCYTEYIGGISTGQLAVSGNVKRNFNAGLALLDAVAAAESSSPDHYTKFAIKLDGNPTDLYDVLRCGLVHEYFGKGLVMVVNDPTDPTCAKRPGVPGVYWEKVTDKDGTTHDQLVFDVNAYFKHFRAAVDNLRQAIIADTASIGPRANFEAATAALNKTITP